MIQHRTRKLLKSEVRFKILQILRNQPNISQRSLSDAVNISLSSVHAMVKSLHADGLIAIMKASTDDEKRYVAYEVTSRGAREASALAEILLPLKRLELASLEDDIRELEGASSSYQPLNP